MDNITIILIGAEKEENIGAIARVMKNFGFKKLSLIEPKCNHLSGKAIAVSTHGSSVLENAKIISKKDIESFDLAIATTAILGDDSHVARTPMDPLRLAKKLGKSKRSVCLVFGRESQGLTTEEILLCDFIVTIPSSKEYPTLNLSHSVGIILYEIAKESKRKESVISHINEANAVDKKVLESHIGKILDALSFQTKAKKETQRRVWKRVIGKAMLSKKEAMSLMGFFQKIIKKR